MDAKAYAKQMSTPFPCTQRQMEFVPGVTQFLTAPSYHLKVTRVGEPEPAYKADSPELFATYWRSIIARQDWFNEDKEQLVTVTLNTRYNITGYSLVSMGSLNETVATPREIFRIAVAAGAYAIGIMHNHPSGDPSPSQADHALTRRVKDGGELLSIKVLDHVIIGTQIHDDRPAYFSFKEAGVL